VRRLDDAKEVGLLLLLLHDESKSGSVRKSLGYRLSSKAMLC
jgi:hypothetical protein